MDTPPEGPSLSRRMFGVPTGLLGRFGGLVMSWSNGAMNRVAVDALDVRPDDRILEVGFGPGRAVEAMAERAAFVAGVDPSEVMSRQATARNRAAIRAGKVQLSVGQVSALPFPDGSFGKVLSVNSYHIWPDPLAGLAEIRRVLTDGGTLLVCLRRAAQPPRWYSSPGLSEAEIARAEGEITAASFRVARAPTNRGGDGTVCLTARK